VIGCTVILLCMLLSSTNVLQAKYCSEKDGLSVQVKLKSGHIHRFDIA
jgi:hypothetical protein